MASRTKHIISLDSVVSLNPSWAAKAPTVVDTAVAVGSQVNWLEASWEATSRTTSHHHKHQAALATMALLEAMDKEA